MLERYGDQLLCVRYHYDKARYTQLTIVELIVAEEEWPPHTRIYPDKLVHVRIGIREIELCEKVKEQEAFWDKVQKT